MSGCPLFIYSYGSDGRTWTLFFFFLNNIDVSDHVIKTLTQSRENLHGNQGIYNTKPFLWFSSQRNVQIVLTFGAPSTERTSILTFCSTVLVLTGLDRVLSSCKRDAWQLLLSGSESFKLPVNVSVNQNSVLLTKTQIFNKM